VRVVRERCTLPRLDVAALDATVWEQVAAALMGKDILKKAVEERVGAAPTGEWRARSSAPTRCWPRFAKEEAAILRLMAKT